MRLGRAGFTSQRCARASPAISGRDRAYSTARAGTDRPEGSLAAPSPGDRAEARAGVAVAATRSRHTNLKMLPFRTSLRGVAHRRGLAKKPTSALSSGAFARPVRGTTLPFPPPLLLAARRRLLIGCRDGNSMKAGSSILRRLICMTCWFEPLILRLEPGLPRRMTSFA
jgi:hypothetical protein